jgi:S-(hydroxymethyl)glutathione dehydrogenase / alcohol dehydrogenase
MDTKHLSRRAMLRHTAAAAAAGAALASQGPVFGQAPAVMTARRFRGWITRGGGTDRTTLQELTLRPISGRQVLVRTEATNLCYSNVGAVLGLQPPPAGPPPGGGAAPGGGRGGAAAGRGGGGQPPAPRAVIQGHGGVGIVEAVGPEVRRVEVGDRVCVSGTPQCGSCYPCLRGRSDMCQFLARIGPNDQVPLADLADGSPVFANSHIGGLAEYMVSPEEWIVPIWTTAAAADVGMVCSCVSVAGLGATIAGVRAQVEPGSTVAVVGCGPLGLSAVQGARIAGATRIIAIDPIRMRREAAQAVGATHVLDPNEEGQRLVARVRELSNHPNTRLWAGGRDAGGLLGAAGADFVVEAAGFDFVPSKLEPSPDPTGLLAIQHAYEMTAAGGHVVTTGLARGNVSIPAATFTIGGRTQHAGQAGGASPMRDIPRFVELLDHGQYDARTLATAVVPLEGLIDAYEQVAYRTTITAILTP